MAINDNLAYQEEPLYEIMDGEVRAMSPAAPRHNRIAGNIFLIFGNYLKKKKCVPFGDGTAVYLDEQHRFIPDFMVVCDRNKIQSKWVYGAPDLLAEILSPSTARNDGSPPAACQSTGSSAPRSGPLRSTFSGTARSFWITSTPIVRRRTWRT